MIPKTIHYCWFGGNPKSKLIKKCIKSWKKYCPDYEIIEWNESNFDINCCPYVKEAYEAKKWAFLTDYARLWIVYNYGGIYLDTDVELVSKLDTFLKYDGYFGFESDSYVNTGLGFGAAAGNKIVKTMLDDYDGLHFLNDDGTYDLTTCPVRNTDSLMKVGLVRNNSFQLIDNNAFFASEVFNPIDYITKKKSITNNTVSIHWYNASWQTKEQRKEHKEFLKQTRKYKKIELRHKLLHLPHLLLRKILGDNIYDKIKNVLKR